MDRHGGWAVPDFTKPGIEAMPMRTGFCPPQRVGVRSARLPGGLRVVIDLHMPIGAADYGCPHEVRTMVDLPDAPDLPIQVVVMWRGKTATRMPEASWFDFNPAGVAPQSWRLIKIGQPTDPVAVVAGGARFLHAVERAEADSFSCIPHDAPLVAPGGPRLLRADDRQPDRRRGISVNLHNNVWGTNFPMWYGEDARFRFTLDLQSRVQAGRVQLQDP
jgi:hypothetical protein